MVYKTSERNSLSKLGAVSLSRDDVSIYPEGHRTERNYCTNEVQTKGKNGAKRLGYTIGEDLLNKAHENWLDEIGAETNVKAEHYLKVSDNNPFNTSFDFANPFVTNRQDKHCKCNFEDEKFTTQSNTNSKGQSAQSWNNQ
eukprot:15508798-Heterocapsa_arctica.AAC.1